MSHVFSSLEKCTIYLKNSVFLQRKESPSACFSSLSFHLEGLLSTEHLCNTNVYCSRQHRQNGSICGVTSTHPTDGGKSAATSDCLQADPGGVLDRCSVVGRTHSCCRSSQSSGSQPEAADKDHLTWRKKRTIKRPNVCVPTPQVLINWSELRPGLRVFFL